MIFSEIYGNYYNTVAAILDSALKEPISSEQIRNIVNEKAFDESILTIPKELSANGKWPLLNEEGCSVLSKETSIPLTRLQKKWMKALLSDSRIKLFNPDIKGLEDEEPLFRPDDFVYFDQFLDGDPYEDEKYVKIFRTILEAVKTHTSVKVKKNGSEKWIKCNPVRIEYSLRDDKFRLLSATKLSVSTINIASIIECETGEKFNIEEMTTKFHKKRVVELMLKDERKALERAMMQFSIYEKVTERIDDDVYKFIVKYEAEDETEILIRIFSFGPNLRVVGPESFIKQIKNRLEKQRSCGR